MILPDSAWLKENLEKNMSAFNHLFSASQNCLTAFSKYANDFVIPYLIATSYFSNVEKQKLRSTSPAWSPRWEGLLI